jgi:uncharacterized Ntn-hydrolase superfamily protein
VSAQAGTYSIVARDPATGELGAAVQSHWFAVGAVVTWARAGVGAVVTQSIPEPAHGGRLLDRLEAGETPAAALAAELDADPQRRFRQLALIGAAGEPAVFTGDGCMIHAGHRAAETYSAQANVMATDAVWGAMGDAFEGSDGPLARRLMAALEAGEAAGGDVRGRQSAAILVVAAAGESGLTVTDLRVDDAPEPLDELRRLLDLGDAYELAERGDEALSEGRHADAAEAFADAAAAAPDRIEMVFWAGLGQAAGGEVEAGAAQVARAIETGDGWRVLLSRLDEELAPGATAVREALGIEPGL